jgi:hypothetical protein
MIPGEFNALLLRTKSTDNFNLRLVIESFESVNIGDQIIITGLLNYGNLTLDNGGHLFTQFYLEANNIVMNVRHEIPLTPKKTFQSVIFSSSQNLSTLFSFDF